MRQIHLTEMIITCESCGSVKRFHVNSQEECDQLFKAFHCENNCGRDLYSFISLGSVQRYYEMPQVQLRVANASY